MFNKTMYLAAAALASTTLHAQAATMEHVVVAPNCLIKQSDQQFKSLASNKSFQLIRTDEKGIQALVTAKHASKHCGGFRDVTRAWQHASFAKTTPQTFLQTQTAMQKPLRTRSEAYKIRHKELVNATLKNITPDNMWKNLTKLSSFPDRYAGSDNGVKAANWLKDKIDGIAKSTGHTDDYTSYFVATGQGYKQPSLVTKFGKGDAPGIVIGAHMDTLNSYWSNKPGADDDGSGTVTLMETARTLLASGIAFEKPIYFIWYSAEEMGLVGSDYVVADFLDKKIAVDAVMQLDMTGYAHNNEPTMWLMKDYTNKDLTAFLTTLIKTYVKKPVDFSMCGYGCSDHASWHQAGFKASFPFESKMGQDDPYIHSSNDTMDVLSLEHMTDYSKLATAYAIELAGPKS